SISRSPMRRIASARCGARGAVAVTSRNFLYAAIACSSFATTPPSFSTATVRPASVFSVGSLSGVPPRRLAQAASRHASASSGSARGARRRLRSGDTRSLLVRRRVRRARGLAAADRAVVELRDREARLRRVDGQALLLLRQRGDRDVLHDTL